MREKITLACSECKQRNYDSMKNKKNDPDRIEMKKYCKFCKKHTDHKETKSELKKVIWPSRQDVINGTGVVIVMVAIVGVIILGFDFFSGWAVKEIMQSNSSSNQIVIDDHDHAEDEAGNVVEEGNTDVVPDSNTEVNNQADVVNNEVSE